MAAAAQAVAAMFSFVPAIGAFSAATLAVVAAAVTVYFPVFQNPPERTMEAERLNAIAEKLADLRTRGRELRRYL